MRVTKNEKFLLTILFAIVFVGGNFFGYRWLAQKQATLQVDYANLHTDQLEAQHDLLEADLWAKRKAWLNSQQPTMTDEGNAKAAVLETVLKGARDAKLEILDQNLNDVQHGPAGTRVNVSVRVKGPMKALANWLATLEKTDQFYSVASFSLKADPDLKSMICTLQIARYFKSN